MSVHSVEKAFLKRAGAVLLALLIAALCVCAGCAGESGREHAAAAPTPVATEAPADSPEPEPTAAPYQPPLPMPPADAEWALCGTASASRLAGSLLRALGPGKGSFVPCPDSEAAEGKVLSGECGLAFVYGDGRGAEEGFTPVAVDALVFLVHRDNPVESLTVEQLRGIYSGEITNWNEVGGKNALISAPGFAANTESARLLEQLVMDGAPIAPAETTFRKTSAHGGSAGAILCTVYGSAENLNGSPVLKYLKVEGVSPNLGTLGSGEYPLTVSLGCLVSPSEPDPFSRAVREWLLSPEGKFFIASCGFVPAEGRMMTN